MGWTTALALVVALLSLAAAQFPVPPGAPSTLTVQFIIRDFVGRNPGPSPANRTTHQDFESTIATEYGIVQNTLGADRKPRLNSSVVTTTWTNATLFNQAWNDVTGVNLRLTRNFQMPWNTATGLYEYSNSNFFPINNDGYGNFGSTGKNFHFCLEYHTQFQFRGTETFAFTGDDDVYFFVNNRLFVDLGGVHGALDASRSLASASVQQQFGLVVGGIYNFDFFFCERHTSASNLKMATNILLNDCLYLDRCGFCTATPPSGPLINPCNTINCGNGTCSCQNATCVCQPGWVNGPLGNCSQRCGDGIIQGSEQCDPPGPCCTSSCTFAPANTVCPSAGRACVNYVCTGTSTTCGVPRAIGSPCNGTTVPPQCQEFQCTAADGSTCALVPNAALTCSDNNACTTDVCTSSGTCVSTSQPCQPSVCRLAGTCNATTGQCSLGTPRTDGTGCGPDPGLSICVQPTCVAGTCTNTSKPVNTPCGGASADGCSTQVCNGNGQCTSVPIVNAQSTKASCPQPAPGSCLQSLCSGTGCANFPIADGSACTNASLTGLTSCQRLGCSAGSCVILPTNEGATCTDGGALNNFGDDACNVKICQSGQCVRKANTAIDGNACNIDSSGVNPEQGCRTYTCSAGACTRADIKEGLACVNASITTDACTQLQCVSGTCTKTPANINGECAAAINSGCTFYRCNSTGSCVAQTAVEDLPCGSTSNKCTLSFCTAGACVPQPVTCNSAICNGLLECTPSTGVCELPVGQSASACCGNGVVDAAGEECDNPNDPCCIDCKFAAPNTACSDNECNPKICVGVAGSQTVCTDNPQDGITCTSAAAPTNQCKELRCGSGTCAEVNKADNTACTLANVPFCGQAVCRSGACQIVADAAKAGADCTAAYGGQGGVPQCNKAVCSGTECVLNDDNEGGACTALPDVECRDRKCSAGSCVYTFDAYPISPRTVCNGVSSSSKCLLPGCDGAGTCILLNATAGTDCDLANNPECNVPKCNGGGVCTLVAINVGSPCSTSRDQQCQTSSCDVNGNCVVANVTDGTACTRTDVGQCQDAVCQGGACVLQSTTATSRVCTPTPDPSQDRSCFNYFCQADGTCETPSNKADGTSCTDANLCDTDTCQAGVCIHAPSVVCNTPTLPCENPDGTCLSAFGNCTYTGRGQYAACTPRASELDPRCNASVVGAYRCSTGAPDSACVPSCFSGGVCGDGIVQAGEDCDWGDPRTGGPCCNITTCKWFEELAPCNNTDPEVVARVNAQIANLSDSSGLPELCFVQRCVFQSGLSVCTLGLDATVSDKCSGTSRSSNNRTAILASVIPGALLALCLAGLGFFLWRRAQKAAEQEWLQEYLNSGNVRVENNAAFVATQNSVNNAAFQPDGR